MEWAASCCGVECCPSDHRCVTRTGLTRTQTTNTNRNDDNGAWNYDIHPDANPQTIDWQQFLGNAPDQPFDEYRMRNWRWFWDFGGGISSSGSVWLMRAMISDFCGSPGTIAPDSTASLPSG